MKIRVVLAAAALLVVSLMAASPASAQYVGGTPPELGPVVNPVVLVPAAPSPARVQAVPSPVRVQAGRVTQARPTQARRAVAVTGADIAQMVLIGGAFVIGGAVLVRQSRRRVTPAS